MTAKGPKVGYTNLRDVKPVIETIFAFISQTDDNKLSILSLFFDVISDNRHIFII